MTPNHTIRNEKDANSLIERLRDEDLPYTVSVVPGAARSISQNALFHAWMGGIAKATHNDEAETKAECHIRWGIPMFRADDTAYSDFIDAALGGKPRNLVVEMIVKGFIPCTRLMSKPLLSRYMDEVWRFYSPHVELWDPSELQWRPKE